MGVVWELKHSVETTADLRFAWMYMSKVANWDDPPARFVLYGPFETGVHGSTEVPGQPLRHWQLLEVKPMEGYTIEFALERASLCFEWLFGHVAGRGTRLTQRVSLSGENASAYLRDIQQAFTSNLAQGMSKIAAAIGDAYLSSQGGNVRDAK